MVQLGCQGRVSSAGVVMLHGTGWPVVLLAGRPAWTNRRDDQQCGGMCAMYSTLASKKKRVWTRTTNLYEPLCHIGTTAALSQ